MVEATQLMGVGLWMELLFSEGKCAQLSHGVAYCTRVCTISPRTHGKAPLLSHGGELGTESPGRRRAPEPYPHPCSGLRTIGTSPLWPFRVNRDGGGTRSRREGRAATCLSCGRHCNGRARSCVREPNGGQVPGGIHSLGSNTTSIKMAHADWLQPRLSCL